MCVTLAREHYCNRCSTSYLEHTRQCFLLPGQGNSQLGPDDKCPGGGNTEPMALAGGITSRTCKPCRDEVAAEKRQHLLRAMLEAMDAACAAACDEDIADEVFIALLEAADAARTAFWGCNGGTVTRNVEWTSRMVRRRMRELSSKTPGGAPL
jgi:hypothetical protein